MNIYIYHGCPSSFSGLLHLQKRATTCDIKGGATRNSGQLVGNTGQSRRLVGWLVTVDSRWRGLGDVGKPSSFTQCKMKVS